MTCSRDIRPQRNRSSSTNVSGYSGYSPIRVIANTPISLLNSLNSIVTRDQTLTFTNGPLDKALERKSMQFTKFKYDNTDLLSNIRAEDGLQQPIRWNALYEGVILPLGSLFGVLMLVLGVMLLRV